MWRWCQVLDELMKTSHSSFGEVKRFFTWVILIIDLLPALAIRQLIHRNGMCMLPLSRWNPRPSKLSYTIPGKARFLGNRTATIEWYPFLWYMDMDPPTLDDWNTEHDYGSNEKTLQTNHRFDLINLMYSNYPIWGVQSAFWCILIHINRPVVGPWCGVLITATWPRGDELLRLNTVNEYTIYINIQIYIYNIGLYRKSDGMKPGMLKLEL